MRCRGLQMNKSSVLSGIHVLLADGNHDTRRIIEVGLSQYGAFVTVVSSAQAGVVVLDQMTPDVIVADLTMPIDDGYWLIAQIRKQHRRSGCRQLPTVAVTPDRKSTRLNSSHVSESRM